MGHTLCGLLSVHLAYFASADLGITEETSQATFLGLAMGDGTSNEISTTGLSFMGAFESIPSPVKGEQGVCVDTPNTDMEGCGCGCYNERKDYCTKGEWDDEDFTALTMCCGCNGGVCVSTTNKDMEGKGCEHYVSNIFLCSYGLGDDEDFTAATMCCTCASSAKMLHILRTWIYVCVCCLPVVTILVYVFGWSRAELPFHKVFEGVRWMPPTVASEEAMQAFLRADAFLLTLAPLFSTAVGLAIVPWGLPSWVPVACAAPFILRAFFVDWWLSCQYGSVPKTEENNGTCEFCSCCSGVAWLGEFMFSKLEVLDAITDGAVVAKAFSLDPATNERFAASMQHLPAWFSDLISVVALRGLLALVMLAGVGAQLSFVFVPFVSAAANASQAGLGGFAATRNGVEKRDMKLVRFFGRVVCEGLPQLLLQTSVAMAQRKDLLLEPLLVASLVSSTLVVSSKAAEMSLMATQHVKENPKDCCLATILFALPTLIGLTLVGFALIRLYFAVTCPSHAWGLSSGCVPSS